MRTVGLIGLSALFCSLLATACADEERDDGGGAAADDDRGRRDTGGGEDYGDTGSEDSADDTSTEDGAVEDTSTQDGTTQTDGERPRDGQLRPDPTMIYLSATGVGSHQEVMVRVFNDTDDDVTFQSAEVVSAAEGFSLIDAPVNETRGPGQAIGFTLAYDAPDNEDVTADIAVYSDFGDPVLIPVIVASKVTEEDACIEVAPGSIAFGTVRRGSAPVTRQFTITNCGAPGISVLRLDRGRIFGGLLPTPAEFQWTADRTLPATLAYTQSITVDVTFTADRAGMQQGLISVMSNVTGRENVRVNLSATSEPPPLSELDVHLVLEWDSNPQDVDFHFMPEGGDRASSDDCYYANMSPDWGTAGDIVDDPYLDYDDLCGPGPENINIDELQPGNYVVWVHYYSDSGTGCSEGAGSSEADATVHVYINGTRRASYGPTRLDHTSTSWDVATLQWTGSDGTLVPINRVFDL